MKDSLFGLSASSDRSDSLAAANSGSTTNSATLFSAPSGTSIGHRSTRPGMAVLSGFRNSPGIGKHALDIDAGR